MANRKIPFQKPAHKNKIWIIDNQTIANFQLLLKEETWNMVSNADNVNRMFNSFHCVLLRYYENSFPIVHKNIIGLNMVNGLQKVLKYHVSGKEIIISYTEIQINVKEY